MDRQKSPALGVLSNRVARQHVYLAALIKPLQHAHDVPPGPALTLTQKPVILTIGAHADKHIQRHVLDPAPIALMQAVEEPVQAEMSAQDEHPFTLDPLDDGFYFVKDLSIHPDEPIVAMSVCLSVLATLTGLITCALTGIGRTFTKVYPGWLHNIRPDLVSNFTRKVEEKKCSHDSARLCVGQFTISAL